MDDSISSGLGGGGVQTGRCRSPRR